MTTFPLRLVWLSSILALVCAAGHLPAWAGAVSNGTPPKLVVVLVMDGLPREQLLRYRNQFGQGGFRRLLDQGASFSSAHQAHGVTYTAVGHAAILTGAYANQHGIIANEWIDTSSGELVYCTDDTRYHYINEKTERRSGTSPERLKVSTLGDEMRYASGNRSKVVAVSGKDRGAILLAGKTGTAYMYMDDSGNFASSDYYMKKHPAWVDAFSSEKPQDRYYGKRWDPLLPRTAYDGDRNDTEAGAPLGVAPNFPPRYESASGKPDASYYAALRKSPFLDELTLRFARAAIEGENLGRNPAAVPDLLGVSLSAHDYINHAVGPESPYSHDHLQRIDRALADFFSYLDMRLGLENILVVFTADHGFANVPEFLQERNMDAGRLDGEDVLAKLHQALSSRFGVPGILKKSLLPNIRLDYDLIDEKHLQRAEVETYAARFLMRQNGVAEVFTRSQFERGESSGTHAGQLMQRAWHRQLSGDLVLVSRPFWIYKSEASGTSHGSPYTYDTNVPLIFMGQRWIKPGLYGQYAEVVDIAATLAHLLNVRKPPAAYGRVLTEILR